MKLDSSQILFHVCCEYYLYLCLCKLENCDSLCQGTLARGKTFEFIGADRDDSAAAGFHE